MCPEDLNQRSNVVFDRPCNHALTASGLKLACSKGLGESTDDGRLESLEFFCGVEGIEEWVIGFVGDSEVGDPAVPDQSLLLVG